MITHADDLTLMVSYVYGSRQPTALLGSRVIFKHHSDETVIAFFTKKYKIPKRLFFKLEPFDLCCLIEPNYIIENSRGRPILKKEGKKASSDEH